MQFTSTKTIELNQDAINAYMTQLMCTALINIVQNPEAFNASFKVAADAIISDEAKAVLAAWDDSESMKAALTTFAKKQFEERTWNNQKAPNPPFAPFPGHTQHPSLFFNQVPYGLFNQVQPGPVASYSHEPEYAVMKFIDQPSSDPRCIIVLLPSCMEVSTETFLERNFPNMRISEKLSYSGVTLHQKEIQNNFGSLYQGHTFPFETRFQWGVGQLALLVIAKDLADAEGYFCSL